MNNLVFCTNGEYLNRSKKNGGGEMVKQANSIKSLSELGVPKQIAEKFQIGSMTAADSIMTGRIIAFKRELGELYDEDSVFFSDRLIEEGFVIPADVLYRTFGVRFIYTVAYYEPNYSDQKLETIERLTNEVYEGICIVTGEQLVRLTTSLRNILSPRETNVIYYRFGIIDGWKHSYRDIAARYNTTPYAIRKAEERARRKLKSCSGALPKCFGSSMYDHRIDEIRDELNALYESEAYRRENELREELNAIAKKSIENSCKANLVLKFMGEPRQKIPCSEQKDYEIRVVDMEFKPRIVNCLLKSGIETTGDIIAMKREDWDKITGMGEASMAEIKERMYSLGFTEFLNDNQD